MLYVVWLLFLLFSISTFSFDIVGDDGFDWEVANITVTLSALAYCDKQSYLNREYTQTQLLKFIPTSSIRSEEHDVNGFIGIQDKSIYVVFRGSQSFSNFLDDLDILQVEVEEYCQGCYVHQGFYTATKAVIVDIIEEIARLRSLDPSLKEVVVTGHSLGAALATITAVDLTLLNLVGIEVRLFNFGSPRVANEKAAEHFSALIVEKYRVTRMKDLVPHLPFSIGFSHISGEFYEDENDYIHRCQGVEDLACAAQWYLPSSIGDHLKYLDQVMGSDACSPPSLYRILSQSEEFDRQRSRFN